MKQVTAYKFISQTKSSWLTQRGYLDSINSCFSADPIHNNRPLPTMAMNASPDNCTINANSCYAAINSNTKCFIASLLAHTDNYCHEIQAQVSNLVSDAVQVSGINVSYNPESFYSSTNTGLANPTHCDYQVRTFCGGTASLSYWSGYSPGSSFIGCSTVPSWKGWVNCFSGFAVFSQNRLTTNLLLADYTSFYSTVSHVFLIPSLTSTEKFYCEVNCSDIYSTTLLTGLLNSLHDFPVPTVCLPFYALVQHKVHNRGASLFNPFIAYHHFISRLTTGHKPMKSINDTDLDLLHVDVNRSAGYCDKILAYPDTGTQFTDTTSLENNITHVSFTQRP